MTILLSIIMAAIAQATPRFDVDKAVDGVVAEAAWEAAVVCTGRQGSAHKTISIRRTKAPAGAIAGTARWDGGGLVEIQLTSDSPPVLIAHEVGHAWFMGNAPLGPLEGRTELLAACIAKEAPGAIPYLYDRFEPLRDVTDITKWTFKSQGAMTEGQVHATYAASLRFFEAFSDLVSAKTVFGRGDLTWSKVRAMLHKHGAKGEALLAVLDGGPDAQRKALEDPDRDGLSTIRESFIGTRPDVWDTNGDGWWDGAPTDHEPRVQPIPNDGTAICPPFISKTGTAELVWGGSIRGVGTGQSTVEISSRNPHIWLPPKTWEVPGGFWFTVEGPDLEPNPLCAVSRRATVRATDELASALPEFSAALEASMVRLEAAVGPAPRRAVVDFYPGKFQHGWTYPFNMTMSEVRFGQEASRTRVLALVPAKAINRAVDRGPEEMTILADTVAAFHWLAAHEVHLINRKPELVTALVSVIRPDAKGTKYFPSSGWKRAKKAVEACDGWKSYMENCR